MVLESKLNGLIGKVVVSIENIQKKRGQLLTSAFVAFIFLLLAMIYVRPSLPIFPDNLTSNMLVGLFPLSENPFDPKAGGFRGVRIGVPLLSWAIGLRGELMAYTSVAIIFGFLFCLFHKYSRNDGTVLVALAITSVFAFSHPILFNLYDLATPDGARVFLAVFMIWLAPNRAAFWALFFINIFTHEGAAVFLPFFLLLRWPYRSSVVGFICFDIIVGMAVIGIYLVFYTNVGVISTSGYLSPWYQSLPSAYNATHDMVKSWAWHGYDAIFAALKLYWIMVGLALYYGLKYKRWHDTLLILSPVACAGIFTLVSPEVTRMMYLAAPVLIISYDQLRVKFGNEKVAKPLIILGLINLVVPQLSSDGGPLWKLPSLFHMIFFWIV